FFFFQAEDGIRDATVTGVQTCALPISGPTAAIISTVARTLVLPLAWFGISRGVFNQSSTAETVALFLLAWLGNNLFFRASARARSEERRVGKMRSSEGEW